LYKQLSILIGIYKIVYTNLYQNLNDHTTLYIKNCISKKSIPIRIYNILYSTYLAAATAPTWGPMATAATAAAMGPALSAAASAFLAEILMDLGLEPAIAVAVAAAF
jgi:hypothetical protein